MSRTATLWSAAQPYYWPALLRQTWKYFITLRQGDRFGIQYIITGRAWASYRYAVRPCGSAERSGAPGSSSLLLPHWNVASISSATPPMHVSAVRAVSVAAAENLPVVKQRTGAAVWLRMPQCRWTAARWKLLLKSILFRQKRMAWWLMASWFYGKALRLSVRTLPSLLLAMTSKRSWPAKPPILKLFPRDSQAHSVVPCKKSGTPENSGGVDGICVLATAKTTLTAQMSVTGADGFERIKGYVEKCIQQVHLKSLPAILSWLYGLIITRWAKESHPYRHQLRINLILVQSLNMATTSLILSNIFYLIRFGRIAASRQMRRIKKRKRTA